MKIDSGKCIACLECMDFCLMGCILEKEEGVSIDREEYVECGEILS